MILEIFTGSFEYSFKNKKAIASVIKVGILSLLSFLILPLLLVFGFSYRVILIGLTGSMSYTTDPMPNFNNLRKMFIQGLKVFLVGFIYFLPTIAIISISLVNGINNINITTILNFTINFNFNLIFFIFLIVSFIGFIFTTVAIPHMVNNNGSISYAFKIKDLIKLIRYTAIVNYLYFFIISIILLLVFAFATFIISQLLITGIGVIHMALYSTDISIRIYTALNVIMFLIFFLFSMGLYTIIESRFMSFIYNEDGLEE